MTEKPPTWIGGRAGPEGEPPTPEDDLEDPADEYQLPEPSPELKASFAKIDALFAGMSRAEALAAVRTLYIDGNHEPRLRQPLRLVPSGDDAGEPAVSASTEDQGDEPPTPPDPAAAASIRDVDTLTAEDRARGEQMLERVLADRARRQADGVYSLSRERYLRRRRRKGLPTPD